MMFLKSRGLVVGEVAGMSTRSIAVSLEGSRELLLQPGGVSIQPRRQAECSIQNTTSPRTTSASQPSSINFVAHLRVMSIGAFIVWHGVLGFVGSSRG